MSQFRISFVLASVVLLGCGGAEEQAGIDFSLEGPNGANAQEEFTETDSGLKYRILRQGTGASPGVDDEVSVSYRGWLDDGREFDSSYQRNQPVEFPLNAVVRGWTEGLQLVSEGGKIELSIPSDLGYGPQGAPPVIPPDAQLHFIVELHEVK